MYYRYDDVQYAALVDEFDNSQGPGSLELRCTTLYVKKVTPKGVWLINDPSPTAFVTEQRFVLNSGKKRYAYPTKEEALQSFIARKDRQESIYHARALKAANAKDLAVQELFRLRKGKPTFE